MSEGIMIDRRCIIWPERAGLHNGHPNQRLNLIEILESVQWHALACGQRSFLPKKYRAIRKSFPRFMRLYANAMFRLIYYGYSHIEWHAIGISAPYIAMDMTENGKREWSLWVEAPDTESMYCIMRAAYPQPEQ
jgi:hypothetical protein